MRPQMHRLLKVVQNQTIPWSIGTAAVLAWNGPGTLTLTGPQTFANPTFNVTGAGKVLVGATSGFGTNNSPFGVIYSGNTYADTGATFEWAVPGDNNPNLAIWSGIHGGGGRRNFAGTSFVRLTAVNTWTGPINVKSGATLSPGGSGSSVYTLSNGQITVENGGTLDTSGSNHPLYTGSSPLNFNDGAKYANSSASGSTPNIPFNVLGTLTVKLNAAVNWPNVVTGLPGTSIVWDPATSASALGFQAVNAFQGNLNIAAGACTVSGQLNTAGAYPGSVVIGGTLNITSAANNTFNGVISGAGLLAKSGAGTASLTATNLHAGAITVSAGILSIDGAGSIYGGAYTLPMPIAGGTMRFNTSVPHTVSGVASGVGALSGTGSAAVTLSNAANTLTGPMTTASAGIIVTGGWTGGACTSAITCGGVFNLNSSTSLTLTGVLTGTTGTLANSSSGVLSLSNAANTYKGNLNIVAGVIAVNAGSRLASGSTTGTINVSSGASFHWDSTVAQTFLGPINGAGSMVVSANASIGMATSNSISGGITMLAGNLAANGSSTQNTIWGTGPMVIAAPAVWSLQGWNSLGGATGPSSLAIAGSVGTAVGTAANLPASMPITITASTAVINCGAGAFGIAGAINLQAFGLNVTPQSVGNSVNISGVISGTGGLNKNTGAGTATLSGANTFTGGMANASSGQWIAGVTSVPGVSGAFGLNCLITSSNFAGSGYNLNGFDTQIGSATGGGAAGGGFVLGSATLTTGADNTNQTLDGAISGTGGVTKIGTGTQTLTNTVNAYTGPTTITGGSIALTGAARINSGAYAGNIAISSGCSIAVGTSAAQTFSGIVSGAGAPIKSGSGVLGLTGVNTYTGDTNILAGNLTIGGGGSLGSGSYAGAINNAGLLVHSSTAAQTLSGVISGVGALTRNTSAATLTLTGANTYQGGTTIAAGVLQPNATGGSTNGLGTGNVTLTGGTLDWAGQTAMTYAGTVTMSPAAVVRSSTSSTVTITHPIVLTGSGTFTLACTAIGSVGRVNITQPIATTGAGQTLSLNPAITNTIVEMQGVLSGPGRLTASGSGIVLMSGANTYTGLTTIVSAILRANGASVPGVSGAFGLNSQIQTGTGATGRLDISGFDTQVGSLISTGVGTAGTVTLGANTLTIGGDNTSPSFNPTISGTGNLVKIGTGAQILTGVNTYTGVTTIKGGALFGNSIGNGGVAGNFGAAAAAASNLVLDGGTLRTNAATTTNRPFTVTANGGTIDSAGVATVTAWSGAPTFSAAGTLTLTGVSTGVNVFSGIIGSAALGNVAKTGTTTWNLSVANTYTGTTTVSAGTLLVNGSLAAGSAVTVNGGTLGGTGTVNGPVTVNSGGALMGGTSVGNTGVLTLAGGQTGNAGALMTVNTSGTTAVSKVTVANSTNMANYTANFTGALTVGAANLNIANVTGVLQTITGTPAVGTQPTGHTATIALTSLNSTLTVSVA